MLGDPRASLTIQGRWIRGNSYPLFISVPHQSRVIVTRQRWNDSRDYGG